MLFRCTILAGPRHYRCSTFKIRRIRLICCGLCSINKPYPSRETLRKQVIPLYNIGQSATLSVFNVQNAQDLYAIRYAPFVHHYNPAVTQRTMLLRYDPR